MNLPASQRVIDVRPVPAIKAIVGQMPDLIVDLKYCELGDPCRPALPGAPGSVAYTCRVCRVRAFFRALGWAE